MTIKQWLISILLVVATAVSPAWAWQIRGGQEYVDLQLILAVDVSRSMNSRKLKLQRDGYVAAFRDADVWRAIESGPQGRIAVTYVEWSGVDNQSIAIPWRIIASRTDARAFADDLRKHLTSRTRRTSISAMLNKAQALFDVGGIQALRRVIDVSGDGPNNSGPPVAAARDALLQRGIVINGLPIVSEPDATPGFFDLANLDDYYRDCVIGGPGSFFVPVTDMRNFAKAIRMKLIMEIANRTLDRGLRRRVHKAQYVPTSSFRGTTNCMIGQQQNQQAPSPPTSK